MPAEQYRINSPTVVVCLEGDHHVSYTLPRGSIIYVEGPNAGNLIDVTWDSKKVKMFFQDLRSRGEQMRSEGT
jgi:hypothetical protein